MLKCLNSCSKQHAEEMLSQEWVDTMKLSGHYVHIIRLTIENVYTILVPCEPL